MMQGRNFKYEEFCSSNVNIDKELTKAHLDTNNICLKCKRYVCKKKQNKKNIPQETEMDCFLRHIRNAIAHGRVYYYHKGNRVHIVFEDENTTGNISARIVCIKSDLIHWKNVLKEHI